MSRAFVKEQDFVADDFADRPVSPNPNVVTPRGLRLIDAEIAALRELLAHARHMEDALAIGRISRDLRYWTQRRSSAQLMEPPTKPDVVAFGTKVTFIRDDDRKQVFSIVGEDESDPSNGFIAYTSPMARALIGKAVGDFVEIPGGEAEITKLEPVNSEG
jgi:transcription elongation GreA/GreB family factor